MTAKEEKASAVSQEVVLGEAPTAKLIKTIAIMIKLMTAHTLTTTLGIEKPSLIVCPSLKSSNSDFSANYATDYASWSKKRNIYA